MMRTTFIKTLTGMAASDDSIYVVSGDAGFGVFEDYKSMYPGRYINSGIAEANATGYAAGMAMAGFNVFVYNIIPFVLYRCFEQVRNDICYQRLPVTLIGIGSGLTYAPGGMTHYSVEDLSLCLALPNLTVISPVDGIETKAAVEYAVQSETPVYIRIAKSGEPVMKEKRVNHILAPEVIREGEGVAVVAYGSIISEAVAAADFLAESGIRVKIISLPTIQPLDMKSLENVLSDTDHVLVLEEHFRHGGLYTRLLDGFRQSGLKQQLYSMAISNQFIHDVRNQSGMRKRFQIDSDAICSNIKKITGIH